MKILITGASGQLGYDLRRACKARGMNYIGTDRTGDPENGILAMDITDEEAVHRVLDETKPDLILHGAAYTAVDKAEDEEDICRKINAEGTRILAKEAGERDLPILYLSTDYVFSGKGEEPYPEDSGDFGALNVYGQTKYEGECFIRSLAKKYFIVRISWVFGPHGNNFVKTMLRLSETRKELNIVSDQVGSPTFTPDLAELLLDMAETEKYGIYHASNEGFCSWYEFAEEIFRLAGRDMTLHPVRTEEYVTKALRPKNSRLSKKRLDENGFKRLPSWQDALKRDLELLGEIVKD